MIRHFKYLILAGGTGGHIIPAMSVANKISDNVLFVTDAKFFNYTIHRNKNITIETVNIKNKYKNKLQHLFYILQTILVISRFIIKYKVQYVIGFGSYVSFCGIIAGFITFRKTYIQEQNTYIGLANKLSLLFVRKCFCGFRKIDGVPKIFLNKLLYTGNPVSDAVIKHAKHILTKDNIVLDACIIQDTINILVIGGSQGAEFIDKNVTEAIIKFKNNTYHNIVVTHQTQAQNIDTVYSMYHTHNIKCNVKTFFDNIPYLISTSHLVIGRAGAMTITELAIIQTPAILIPIQNSYFNHQLLNAKYAQRHASFCVLTEETATPTNISSILASITQSPNRIREMCVRARTIANIDAITQILNEIR